MNQSRIELTFPTAESIEKFLHDIYPCNPGMYQTKDNTYFTEEYIQCLHRRLNHLLSLDESSPGS